MTYRLNMYNPMNYLSNYYEGYKSQMLPIISELIQAYSNLIRVMLLKSIYIWLYLIMGKI